jgi:4-aminobutyrate aminotransferase-like enzyme
VSVDGVEKMKPDARLAPQLDVSASRELNARARRLIPGASHTYAKGDDQFPVNLPIVIARGQGCRVWDVDGNEFIEFGMGLRSVTLGHAFAPVVEAARAALELGTNYSRPAAIEVECAEALQQLIGSAEMVKFCKNGSDALDGAVKLARPHRSQLDRHLWRPSFLLHRGLVHRHHRHAGRNTRLGARAYFQVPL